MPGLSLLCCLQKFLPNVYNDMNDPHTKTGLYCSFNNQILQFMTSSLFLAGKQGNRSQGSKTL